MHLKKVLRIPGNPIAISWKFHNHLYAVTYYPLVLQPTSVSFHLCFYWSSFHFFLFCFLFVSLEGLFDFLVVLSDFCDVISKSSKNVFIRIFKMWSCVASLSLRHYSVADVRFSCGQNMPCMWTKRSGNLFSSWPTQ